MIKFFYLLKPLVPRRFQLMLRRLLINVKRKKYSEVWPIDRNAAKPPSYWKGWPDNKKFALVLTHDIESIVGLAKCRQLMKLEIEFGYKSSYNFVPGRYELSAELRNELIQNGFEVGVHGLIHDGKLFASRKIFLDRAQQINKYLREWKAVGFRSPSMHHNLDWIHELDIEYDASTFDTDPFEPQSDGAGTIFPFWVSGDSPQGGYVELPYTLPQDFALFIIMKEKGIDIWKQKLDWIAENGGMVLVITHPDYMNFKKHKLGPEEYPAQYYLDLLLYIKDQYKDQYWNPLPKVLSRYIADNC